MGRVVVVTFDENEEEKLNELLHFLSAKKYSEMPDKQNMQILLERYAYSEISGTFILI